MAAVAAFFPWLTLNVSGTGILRSLDANREIVGIDGDGKFTLALGLLTAGACHYRWQKWTKRLAAFSGIIISLIALYYVTNPGREFDGIDVEMVNGSISTNYGLYLTLLAGVLVLIGGILSLRSHRSINSGQSPR